MDERTGIAIEVDRLFGIEEHILACINLQNEVFQGTHSHDACNLVSLVFAHIVKLAQFLTGLLGVADHECHQVVGIDNSTFTALHLTIGKFDHTIGEVDKFLTPLETEAIEEY